MKKGKIIVFEGLDGSGKQTQSELFYKRLADEGCNVLKVSFPRYDNDSSALVRMYLKGEFGSDANGISPYICSTFYAVDRYASYKQDFEDFYNKGGIVVADRYTTSNMLHQASKIHDNKEREKFLSWLYELEFNIYSLPKPDMVFFLDMPFVDTKILTKDRANKITGASKKDIHETDENHLKSAYITSRELIEKYGWIKINCVKDGIILSIDDIARDVYNEFIKRGGMA